MATMLAVLVALGIYAGIPCVIGLAIVGVVRLAEGIRKVGRAGVAQRKPVETEAMV
jgi:hypothetical protein